MARPARLRFCFCPTPLLEERPYGEDYFKLTRVQDAHDRRRYRDYKGSEPWPVSTVIAQSAWSNGWKRGASRFSTLFAAMQMRPDHGPSADGSVNRDFDDANFEK